jgi:hypothetical protein
MSESWSRCSPLCSVLVIDDSLRFALHVWRYLSGSIGFGIGMKAESSGNEKGRAPGEPGNSRGGGLSSLVLETALGEVEVLWVKLEKDKEAVLGNIKRVVGEGQSEARKFLLVLDVHVETVLGTGASIAEVGEEGGNRFSLERTAYLLERLRETCRLEPQDCSQRPPRHCSWSLIEFRRSCGRRAVPVVR